MSRPHREIAVTAAERQLSLPTPVGIHHVQIPVVVRESLGTGVRAHLTDRCPPEPPVPSSVAPILVLRRLRDVEGPSTCPGLRGRHCAEASASQTLVRTRNAGSVRPAPPGRRHRSER